MKNLIGLHAEKSQLLAGKLNDLLANYQLFYINTRGFYGNITGEKCGCTPTFLNQMINVLVFNFFFLVCLRDQQQLMKSWVFVS